LKKSRENACGKSRKRPHFIQGRTSPVSCRRCL
jgi:hypothetical protein